MKIFFNIISVVVFSFFGDYQIEINDKLNFDDNSYKIYNDLDNDGIMDSEDNCPNFYNPQQIDRNNNGIGDICEENIEDPDPFYISVEEIFPTNSFYDLINPYVINDDYYTIFNQGYSVIDFNNDGKQDFVSMFYESERFINIAGIGIFSFDFVNGFNIKLNEVIQILGEPNANSPDVGYFNDDDSLDIFIPTGNYHGDDNTQPPFYNGTYNRPDFLYYKNQNSFRIDSLDYTYDDQIYSNTSFQKSIQIDEDISKEIAILTYDKQMAFYDYDTEKGRHELIREITTSEDKFNDIYNIHFDEDEFEDLITLSVSRGSINTYKIHKYSGYENSTVQIDFNSKEFISEFQESEEWDIAENEEFTSIISIDNRKILLVQFVNLNGESKLISYDLSTNEAKNITSYLFGNDFANTRFEGLGHFLKDFDGDGDLDLIFEHEYATIYLQNEGRFHPVIYNNEELGENNRSYIFIDLNEDGIDDIINPEINKFYITNSISLSNPLSVSDELLDNNFLIFPNPVSNIFRIESKNVQISKVEIYSILGEKIKEITSNFGSITTDKLPKGIYVLRIYSEKSSIIRKIIKI